MAECQSDHSAQKGNFCPYCGVKIDHLPIEKDADYITILACTNPQRALVCVMHYDKPQDGYTLGKMSDALSVRAARALAESWAAALKLEIR